MKILGLFLLVIVTGVCYLIGDNGPNNNAIGDAAAVIFIPLAIAVYFYPSLCAMGGHPKAVPIFALNLLAGWTFIGWLGAFIWALTESSNSQTARSDTAQEAPAMTHGSSAEEKVCPYCAETIKAAAVKCRYCGSELQTA